MTETTFFIGLAVTILIAVANIINQWLLARYNKKQEQKLEKEQPVIAEKPKRKKKFWTSRKFALLQFVAGAYSATSAFLFLTENTTLQVLSLAIGVSAMFSAFPSDVGGELAALVDHIVAVIEAQVDAARSHSKWNDEVFRKIIENEKLVASQIEKIVAVLAALDIPADKQATVNELKEQLELYAEGAAQLPQENTAQ